jgi:hypothetical protein
VALGNCQLKKLKTPFFLLYLGHQLHILHSSVGTLDGLLGLGCMTDNQQVNKGSKCQVKLTVQI